MSVERLRRLDPFEARGPRPRLLHPVGPPVRSAAPPSGRRRSPSTPQTLLEVDVPFWADDRRPCREPLAEEFVDHRTRFGVRASGFGESGARLLEDVETVGLAGRGGSYFPVATKLRGAIEASRRNGPPVVVANGAEGEPASVKDAALLQSHPHLVIDGLVIAAELVGAAQAVIWLHESAVVTRAVLMSALRQRRLDGVVEVPVRILTGRDHYLTGESKAVAAGVIGRLPVPYFSRVPVTIAGLDGRPTVVQNVETLARLALLARYGPDAEPPGPLLTVLGQDASGEPLLVARQGCPEQYVAEALEVTSGRRSAPQAVLVGGFGGTWARWEDVAALRLGDLARRPGSGGPDVASLPSLGPGMLLAVPPGACPVTETAAVVRYLAQSSAGQCGPCLRGAPAIAEAWERLADGHGDRRAERRLLALADAVDRRGACALPDAIARITRSALTTFPDEFALHARGVGCGREERPPTLPVPLPSTPGPRRLEWLP